MSDLGIVLILLAHLIVFIWMQIRIENDLSQALGSRRDWGWPWFGYGRGAVATLSAINRLRDRRVEECPLCHRRKIEGFTRCSCGAPYGAGADPRLVAVLKERCARGQNSKKCLVKSPEPGALPLRHAHKRPDRPEE